MKAIKSQATIAAFALATAAHAQTQWSTSMYYDLKDKSWAGVVTTPLTTFKSVLGLRGFEIDLDAFAGVSFGTGSPVAGFSLGKRFPLADTVTGYFGVGVKAENRVPVSVGPTLGLSVKF